MFSAALERRARQKIQSSSEAVPRLAEPSSGAQAEAGDAERNTVFIQGGTIAEDVVGGDALDGNANDNAVIVTGGTINGDIIGGISNPDSSSGNTIIIAGGTTMETLLEATERPTEASSGIQSISLAEPLAKMPASTEVFLPGPTTEPSKEIRSTLLQKELP